MFLSRYKNTLFFSGAILIGIILAYVGSFYFKEGFNYLYYFLELKRSRLADWKYPGFGNSNLV